MYLASFSAKSCIDFLYSSADNTGELSIKVDKGIEMF